MTGKPIGQDPQNGNVTLPLILAMAGTSKQQRMEVLHRIENGSSEDSEWIGGFVEENGGVEKAQKKAEDFSRKAISVLNDFPESRFRVSLEQLILYDLERPG